MSLFSLKQTNKNAKAPTRATAQSSGYDLHAAEAATIMPGARALIGVGWALCNCKRNVDLQIRPRSGLAYKHGVTVLNAPGTIDPDYREEIKVLLINHGDAPYEIKIGDRIAQMVVGLCYNDDVEGKDRSGGFGSTGD